MRTKNMRGPKTNWYVNREWLKKKLLSYYDPTKDRRLIESTNNSNYGKVGYYMFALEGSPPKGFAVYQPEIQTLLVYNMSMNTSEVYRHIIIQESDVKWMYTIYV